MEILEYLLEETIKKYFFTATAAKKYDKFKIPMTSVFIALSHIKNIEFVFRIIKITKNYDVPFWSHYALILINNIIHIVEN